MNFIEERIRKEGCVKPGGVLKVDSFLNHQIDMALVDEIAEEFVRRFAESPVTKVLTIETSGIILARMNKLWFICTMEYNLAIKRMKSCHLPQHIWILNALC